MPLHIVRLGSPRAPGEGLRIGTLRGAACRAPRSRRAARAVTATATRLARTGAAAAHGSARAGLAAAQGWRPEFARTACLAWLLGQRHPGQPALRHELPAGLECDTARGLEAGRA